MTKPIRGRHQPSPPLPYPGSGAPAFEWAFPWNAPRPAIEPPVDLLAESQKQTEEQIAATLRAHHLLEQQPQLIQRDVRYHVNRLEESQGIRRGNAYLTKNFVERVLPRLDLVNEKYRILENNIDADLCQRFNRLPDASRADVELLAKDIAITIKRELSVIDEDAGGASEFPERVGAIPGRSCPDPPIQTDPAAVGYLSV